MDDTDLINRARQGDGGAYEQLMQRYQAVVFRLAYLLLRNRQDAEETAQDTFLAAYRVLARFDTARPLRPWLLQMTRNLAANRRRSVRRYLNALWRAGQGQASSGFDEAQREDIQALLEQIRRLAQADQEIIYLRYFLDLSVEETAQAIGVAEGTVKSRLHRALGRLRGLLKDELPELWKEGRT